MEVVVRVPGRAKPEKGFEVLGALRNEIDCREPAAGLLGQYVALLAMKHGRAPLPALARYGEDYCAAVLQTTSRDSATFARRYLFLGDARMLLAESRKRPVPVADSVAVVKQMSEERLRY